MAHRLWPYHYCLVVAASRLRFPSYRSCPAKLPVIFNLHGSDFFVFGNRIEHAWYSIVVPLLISFASHTLPLPDTPSALGKSDPFVLIKSDPHQEQDLAQGKCGTTSSSTPKACNSLIPRRRFTARRDEPAGLGFGAGQNRSFRHPGVGHSSRANPGNFSRAPK